MTTTNPILLAAIIFGAVVVTEPVIWALLVRWLTKPRNRKQPVEDDK